MAGLQVGRLAPGTKLTKQHRPAKPIDIYGISLIWCHFYSCLLSKWLFAEKFSNCSNSLNFEAKINCNSIKSNVPKWRKICIGLKFDLVHFNGPQTKFKNVDNFGGPCIRKYRNILRKNQIYLQCKQYS